MKFPATTSIKDAGLFFSKGLIQLKRKNIEFAQVYLKRSLKIYDRFNHINASKVRLELQKIYINSEVSLSYPQAENNGLFIS